jgi:hypothetical protein
VVADPAAIRAIPHSLIRRILPRVHVGVSMLSPARWFGMDILVQGPDRIVDVLEEMEAAAKAVEPGSEFARAVAAQLDELENRIVCMGVDLRRVEE